MKLRNLVLACTFTLAAFAARPDAAHAGGYVYGGYTHVGPSGHYCPPNYGYGYYPGAYYGYRGYDYRPYPRHYYGSYYDPGYAYYYPRKRHYRHYRRVHRRHHRRW